MFLGLLTITEEKSISVQNVPIFGQRINRFVGNFHNKARKRLWKRLILTIGSIITRLVLNLLNNEQIIDYSDRALSR